MSAAVIIVLVIFLLLVVAGGIVALVLYLRNTNKAPTGGTGRTVDPLNPNGATGTVRDLSLINFFATQDNTLQMNTYAVTTQIDGDLFFVLRNPSGKFFDGVTTPCSDFKFTYDTNRKTLTATWIPGPNNLLSVQLNDGATEPQENNFIVPGPFNENTSTWIFRNIEGEQPNIQILCLDKYRNLCLAHLLTQIGRNNLTNQRLILASPSNNQVLNRRLPWNVQDPLSSNSNSILPCDVSG